METIHTIDSIGSHIDTPYPYICLQDLHESFRTLVPDMSEEECAFLESELFFMQNRFAPENSNFYSISTSFISEQLEKLVEQEVSRSDINVGVVHMDKAMGSKSESPRYFQLNLSRASDGTLASRIGCEETPEEQMNNLCLWARSGLYDEILFVDDVLAFGETTSTLFDVVRGHIDHTKIRLLVGVASSGGVWRGIQKIEEENGIAPEYLVRVEASPEVEGGSKGMAIPTSRDLTLIGGKVGPKILKQNTSMPYFLPFSEPLSSIIRTDAAKEASLDLLDFNSTIFEKFENHLGKPLRIGDLALKGFGIPYTSLPEYRQKLQFPSTDQKIRDYIAQAKDIL